MINWELILGLTVFSLVLAWISDVAADLSKKEMAKRLHEIGEELDLECKDD